MPKDYYAELELQETAGADEIKSAYRRLAFAWHPDKNPGNAQAEERFKAVSEAYSVLSDPAKKARYDEARRFGGSYSEQGQAQGYGPQQGAAYGFGFDFAFNQEMASFIFYQEMSKLAAELTMRNVPKDKIAEELMKRGCPAEVAHKIAASYEGKRVALIKSSAQSVMVQGVSTFVFGAALFFMGPLLRVVSLFPLVGGLIYFCRGAWMYLTKRVPKNA
jgi:curved DNA-binding protein CbpA